LERVLLTGVGADIRADSLPIEVLEGQEAYLAPGGAARPTLEDVERRYIELTLTYARQPDESGRHPRHQPESVVGKAAAIRTALIWTGDALLAACLAPRCACCHGALESPIAGPI